MHRFERAERPDLRHAIGEPRVMSAILHEIVFNVVKNEVLARLFWLPENQWSHLVALTPEARERFDAVLGNWLDSEEAA